MRILGVIPCRYQSSRFPGKPLAIIANKPMMWHVYKKAMESNVLDEVYIATDDERIYKVANELQLNVIMTQNSHSTGTDRVAEVSEKVDADFYVNIQGDEPLIDIDSIRNIVKEIVDCSDTEVQAINAYASISDPSHVVNSNVVKVIVDVNSNAIAFSRQPIPYPKSGEARYYQQLGLYAFKKSALQIFSNSSPQYLEKAEDIEMYRLIENGYKIRMMISDSPSISVDTPNDLLKVRDIIEIE
jgi:3-deoxy-manno-octulosonate cytidylyltransferase (CMP-KDO synthetase)